MTTLNAIPARPQVEVKLLVDHRGYPAGTIVHIGVNDAALAEASGIGRIVDRRLAERLRSGSDNALLSWR